MGLVENPQLRPQPITEHQGVHQAARPGDNRRPAAGRRSTGMPNSRQTSSRTSASICDDRPTTTIGCRGSHKPQRFAGLAGRLGFVQQRFVERQVLGGSRQREIEILHGDHCRS